MKRISLLAGLLLITSVFCVFGADKFGYVDMEKVFNDYYKTARESLNFEKRRQVFEEQMNVLKSEFDTSYQEFERLMNESENELLSENERNDAQRKAKLMEDRLHQKDMEMQRTYQEGVQELQRSRNDMEEKIISELISLVRKYALDHGYTHVLEVSGKTLNRVPAILLYPENEDFTEDLLTSLNGGHEKELEEARSSLQQLRSGK